MEVYESVLPDADGMTTDFARVGAVRPMRDADDGVPPSVEIAGWVETVAFAHAPQLEPAPRGAARGHVSRHTGVL